MFDHVVIFHPVEILFDPFWEPEGDAAYSVLRVGSHFEREVGVWAFFNRSNHRLLAISAS